jgi:hypothetical protein
VILERVSEGEVRVDLVAVAAADTFTTDVARVLQLGDDALGGALGDADALGDLSQEHIGVLGDAQQDVRVIREERPTVGARHGRDDTAYVSRKADRVNGHEVACDP